MYKGLKMYNNVRWLSRGLVLKRFVECFNEIKIFLKTTIFFIKKCLTLIGFQI